MELEALQWFLAVADGDTVGDTARRFHRSQPAVTRGLQRLADEVGVPLTERWGRRLRPTYAGEALATGVRRALADLDEALRAVAEAADPDGGTVRLGFLSPLGSWLVPALLVAFRAERPRVDFVLRHDGAERILAALLDGELDLLLSMAPPEGSGARWERFLTEELAIAVGQQHRLAGRAWVRPAELAGEAWVIQPPGYGLRARAEELAATAGGGFTIAFEGHDMATLHALIAAGSGIGLVPVAPAPPAGVVLVRLRPGVHRAVGLLTVPGRLRPPSADAFADLVRHRAATITPDPAGVDN